MRIRNIVTGRYWSDLAWELGQKAAKRKVTDAALSQSGELRHRITIDWPAPAMLEGCEKWLLPLQRGFQELATVRAGATESFEQGFVLPMSVDNSRFRIAIDIADKPELDERIVDEVDLYFKMQYARGGYDRDDVVPGGYVANDSDLYSYLPTLWDIQANQPDRYEVYGRFGAQFATAERRRALDLLNAQPHFQFEGSLKIIRYSRYLREIARAKICINLPGNGDLCFRLFDYMAVGAFVVSHPLCTELPSPLRSGEHFVCTEPDFSDLVDLCRYYLEHEEERRTIQRNARAYFLEHIHYQRLTSYYLKTCLQRLPLK